MTCNICYTHDERQVACWSASVRRSIHPPVRLRIAVGRAGLLPRRRRAHGISDRSAALVDAPRRHGRVAADHDSCRPARPPPDAARGRRADGGCRARVRLHEQFPAAPCRGHHRRDQPERPGGGTVSADRAGHAGEHDGQPGQNAAVRLVHADRRGGNRGWGSGSGTAHVRSRGESDAGRGLSSCRPPLRGVGCAPRAGVLAAAA